MAWRLIVRTRRVEAQVESEARFWKGLFALTTRKVCLVQRWVLACYMNRVRRHGHWRKRIAFV
jgi:hypothetical protein